MISDKQVINIIENNIECECVAKVGVESSDHKVRKITIKYQCKCQNVKCFSRIFKVEIRRSTRGEVVVV